MRQERPLKRPRKERNEDDDDAPTYVDEESQNIISKAEYESLANVTDDSHRRMQDEVTVSNRDEDQGAIARLEERNDSTGDIPSKPPRKDQQKTDIGSRKRRKAVKVVTGDHNDHHDAQRRSVSPKGGLEVKPRKNKQKIKLSFDDHDDKAD